jgi:hypothetical protein
MNIINEKPVIVFRNEYNGKVTYQTSLSRKDKDGNYVNGYIPIQFKNGNSFNNQEKIYIKDAWLSFYNIEREFNGKKNTTTRPYIFINEYETIEETITNSKIDNELEEDPYVDFGNSFEINDNDLAF